MIRSSTRRARASVLTAALTSTACAAAASPAHGADPPAADGPTVRFHGQFRLNSYALLVDSDPEVVASRLRIRPTVDVDFSPDTALHVQLNIGHITANLTQARLAHDGGPAVGLRHMVLRHGWGPGLVFEAGLVPLSDAFGDTLFSSDWDFSPLAAVARGVSGDWRWRVALGQVVEADERWDAADDVALVLGDLDFGSFGASVYGFHFGTASPEPTRLLVGGARYRDDLGPLNLRVNLLASHLAEREQAATGFAGLVELRGAPGGGFEWGLLSVVSTGEDDPTADGSRAFVTPMSALGAHGYWGYTARLTVQGPTDTGVDDPLNIDGGSYNGRNAGRGLLTVQAMTRYSLSDRVVGYLAVGLFRGMADGGSEGRDLGLDGVVQLTWKLAEHLALDTGLAVTRIGPGHPSATDVESRFETLAFSRLQLEY